MALSSILALVLTACPRQETTTGETPPPTTQVEEDTRAVSPLESWPELDAVADAFQLNDEGKQAIADAIAEDPEGDQVAPYGELAPAPELDLVRGVAFVIDLDQDEVDRLFNTSVFSCGAASVAEFQITTVCGGETMPPGPMLVAMFQTAATLDVTAFGQGESFEIAVTFASTEAARNYRGAEGDYHNGAVAVLGFGNHSGRIEATGRVWDGSWNDVQPNLRAVLFGEPARFGGQEGPSYSGTAIIPLGGVEREELTLELGTTSAVRATLRALAGQLQNQDQTRVAHDEFVAGLDAVIQF